MNEMQYPASYSSSSENINKRIEQIETTLGINPQGSYATLIAQLTIYNTLLQELHDDHAVFKTAADAVETLIEELHDDHASLITWMTEVDGDEDGINNYLDFLQEPDGVIGGNFSISIGAAVTLTGAGHLKYRIGGQIYYSDLDTTITLADDGDVDDTKWRAWRIEIARDGTVTATADGDTQHANEEDALLNLAGTAQTANTATIGYFTIHSNGGFNIGTDNVNGETAANIYHVRGAAKQVAGLTAALGSAVVADTGAATWSSGTIDAMRNGLRLTQVGAITNQAMDDADTIATVKAGGWLLVLDLAGTGIYALAADSAAGSVSAMSYADTDAVDTALDTLCDQLPELFCPIAKIVVDNASGGTFTAGTTNWDAADITTTVTDATVGTWDRTANTGFDSHKINPPSIPASIAAVLLSTLTAAKPASAPATLTAAKPT